MRRRTQPIAKLYAFHENAINLFLFLLRFMLLTLALRSEAATKGVL